jgi:thioredoxin-related protein
MKKVVGLLWLPAILISGELKNFLLKAKNQQKPLMVMVTSEECRYCKKMKNETLKNSKVEEELQDFLFARIDKEDSEAKRYLPTINYAPTIFFVSPKFQIINTAEGYLPPHKFIPWIEDTKTKLGINIQSTESTLSSSGAMKREEGDNWMYDIASGIDYATQTGKQLMIFVGSSRSKWSQKLEKHTLKDSKVKNALKEFVWVKITKGDSDAAYYGISTKKVPYVYFMTSDLRELVVAKGYFAPKDFLQYIKYAKSKI